MKEILNRTKGLLIKALSIKVLAASVLTFALLNNAVAYGILGFGIVAFMWTVVIGDRTLEKYIEAIKALK